jgi:hypothetical protein
VNWFSISVSYNTSNVFITILIFYIWINAMIILMAGGEWSRGGAMVIGLPRSSPR